MLCKICGEREASYRSECKVCNYKKRNKDKIFQVIAKGFWCENELDIVIYHMLYNSYNVINNIVGHLPNKNLSDLVNLLEFDMPIKGTAKNRVELQCYSCGEKIIRPLKHYYKDRAYCSFECRDKYKTENLSGENSKFYKRVDTVCSNCGKKMSVIPFDFNKTNSLGENNNFCSQECYYQYRSKHYSGDMHPMYNYQFSEEQKELVRERMIKRIKNGEIAHTFTKPHENISNLLNTHSIIHENEYSCKYYSIDIYLPNHNLMIEIMGDYWHASPLKYLYDNLSDIQKKDIVRDKSKHTYIKKYYDCEILYLWESDIINNIDLCWMLIDLYICNNGILSNYHSFNYHIENNSIVLNNNIINPFFITQNPYRLQGDIGNNIAEVVHL